METAEVDYLIIGAGMAGTVLHRFLQHDSVAILDPRPAGYKIGESIIPEHFLHPELRQLVPKAKQLPSYAPKFGVMFVCDGSVASFPLPAHGADAAMHVARSELEALMHQEWQTPVVRERVTDVQLSDRIVVTDQRQYKVRRQIIDCSGPAMVVARHCAQIDRLWPVWARWAYLDIEAIQDDAFWSHLRNNDMEYRRFDVPNGQLLPAEEDPDWRPSRNTILTQIAPGIWTWQIPLYDHAILSFGVVSRHGMPTEEDLFAAATKHAAPHYRLRRRSPSEHWLDRIHTRCNFARMANPIATDDYILLADAAGFADPVYSVGTGLAVNKAIELASVLNEEGWNPTTRDRYIADHTQLFDRAFKAFDTWYTGEVMTNDAAAREVQSGFLMGTAFQVGIAQQYSRVLADAGPAQLEGEGEVPGRHQIDPTATPLTEAVRDLLTLSAEQTLAGWQLTGAYRTPTEVQHRWSRDGMPELVVNTSFDPANTRYYRRIGDISLSFMNLWDREYPMDASCVALFDALEDRIAAATDAWHALAQATH